MLNDGGDDQTLEPKLVDDLLVQSLGQHGPSHVAAVGRYTPSPTALRLARFLEKKGKKIGSFL